MLLTRASSSFCHSVSLGTSAKRCRLRIQERQLGAVLPFMDAEQRDAEKGVLTRRFLALARPIEVAGGHDRTRPLLQAQAAPINSSGSVSPCDRYAAVISAPILRIARKQSLSPIEYSTGLPSQLLTY